MEYPKISKYSVYKQETFSYFINSHSVEVMNMYQ